MQDNPNLSPEQLDRIRSIAQFRSVQDGEVLYEPSQPDIPLFIVLDVVFRSAGPERTTRFLRCVKQVSSPARCR
jgi:hypothetical protein